MFAGVVRQGKQNDVCKGIGCRFSDEYIGEKAEVVGYCLWCDSDKMQKTMESNFLRNSHVKKGLQFFYDNDEDVFRMALTRLPVEYRAYWPLKALGLSQRFYREEIMKAALEDKNSNRYRNFITELKALFVRDERLCNFVCESLPSDAVEDFKREISVANSSQSKRMRRNRRTVSTMTGSRCFSKRRRTTIASGTSALFEFRIRCCRPKRIGSSEYVRSRWHKMQLSCM